MQESGPVRSSPVPWYRILQPPPNRDRGAGLAKSRCGTRDAARLLHPSSGRGSWRKNMTRTSRLLARVIIATVTVMAPLVFATTAQAGPVRKDPWDRLAQCESGGNWNANTGNGYYGGLQFSHETWRSFGGGAYASTAHQASRSQQIAIAEKVLRAQGWKAWPSCSRKVGLR